MDPQQEAAIREAILKQLLAGGSIGPAPMASHPQPLQNDDQAILPVASHPARAEVILATKPMASHTPPDRTLEDASKRPIIPLDQPATPRPRTMTELMHEPSAQHPALEAIRNAVGGATGLQDPFTPESSPWTVGAAGLSLLPLGQMFSGLKMVEGALPAVGKGLRAAESVAPEIRAASGLRVHPATSEVMLESRRGLPKARGSLAKTIEFDKASGLYRIKTDVQDRLHHFYDVGYGIPSNWEGSGPELLQAFGDDEDAMRQYAYMWGATSPRTDVATNTKQAVAAQLWRLEHPGEQMTFAQGRAVGIHPAGTKVPNLNRAMTDQRLSGEKANAMGGFMHGERTAPVDVHILHGAGAKNTKLDQEYPALRALMSRIEKRPLKGQGAITDREIYKNYTDALMDSIQEFEAQRKYHPLFGQLWEGIRKAKGEPYQGGPLDLLRAKGLLERGAMLDPVRLKEALLQQGWKPGAMTALLAAIYLGEPAPDGRAAPTPIPSTTAPAPGSRSAGM